MLSGTDALFVNPKDELAAWTLKFKLPELLPGLFIQWLKFIYGHLSAVHASHIFFLLVIDLLTSFAEYSGTRTAHYWVIREVSAKSANEVQIK